MVATVEKKVQQFDFTRSKRLSRDHRAGFEFASQTMSKMLTAYFTTLFRKLVEVRPGKVRDIVYYDFIETRESPTCLWTFEDANMPHMGILEIQTPFTFLIIDRLFSGRGLKLDNSRPLTSIEQSILKRVIDRIFQIWDQSWRPIHRCSSRAGVFESQAYLVQIAGKNDPAIHLTFDVLFGDDKFVVDFCLPYSYMDPFLLKMKDQNWAVLLDEENENADRDIIMPTVLKTKNTVFASLGNAKITIKDYVELKPGQVIRLDQPVDKPLVAYIADKPCFLVKAGVKENKKAIKILHRFKEASDEWILEN